MKFNLGEWRTRPGVTVYNCEQIRKITLSPDRRELRLYTVCYRDNVRGLDGPSQEIVISSPLSDAIRLTSTHFKGEKQKYPQFETEDRRLPLDYTETENEINVSSGQTRLCIKKTTPCAFTFYYGKRLLTSVGSRFGSAMLSYITTPEGPFMRGQLDVDVGEKIYGLGERFTPFVRNGQSIDVWNEDGGTSTEISYKNVPFYLSSNAYGVLVNDPGKVSFEVCSEAVTKVQFSVPGHKLDFTLIGAPNRKGVLSRYAGLSGKPALPPAWSFGLWLSSSFTTSYDEATVSEFVDGMASRDIPLSVFHFDCFWMKENQWCGFDWDEDVFPDVRGMLARMHEKGLKVCVWINPYVGQNSRVFDELAEKDYLLHNENGDIWQWDLWQAGCAVYDFTNPDAAAWYRSKLKELMDMGVDCFKTDFGERIPTDVVWFDGSDPQKMHNYYAYLYNKLVFDTVKEVKGEKEALVFARSATVGSQKFPVHWGGDCNSTYVSMSESLRGGLGLCLSGFGFWSHDMGGFEGTAPEDVYKRWLAFGLLSTHSRLHGSDSYRVPWLFGEEAVDVCRKFAKLKNRLMPYLFGSAVETSETGVPMMRAMMLEFEDIPCEDLDRQYMLGDALLVAPVFRENGNVDFYLPKGKWTHLLSEETALGGEWRTENHSFFSLPLYVRENTVLPLGSCDSSPEYGYTDNLELCIFNLADGADAKRRVCSKDGETALLVSAKRDGKTIYVSLAGETESVKISQIGTDCEIVIEKH